MTIKVTVDRASVLQASSELHPESDANTKQEKLMEHEQQTNSGRDPQFIVP